MRRFTSNIIGLAAVATTTFATGCGKPSSSERKDANGESTSTAEGQDTSQPFTLEIGTASVDTPAGALDPGASVKLADGTDVPTNFTQTGVISASGVIALSAVDGTGQELVKAKEPMTLAIDTSSVAALTGVDMLASNLCAFGLGASDNFMVWRNSALKNVDASGGSVKFLTQWFGQFQLVYCGDVEIPGANAVAADGKSYTEKTPPKTSYGACDLRESAGLAYSMCYEYTGSLFGDAKYQDTPKTGCASFQKEFKADGTCPADGAVGLCVFYGTSTYEYVLTYYPSDTLTTDDLKAHCTDAKGTWYEPGTFVAGQNSATYEPE